MSRRTPSAIALATVVSLTVAVAPATAATSKAEKRQNSSIKKNRTSINKHTKSIAKNTKAVKRAGTAIKKADDKAGLAITRAGQGIDDAKKANDGVNTINTTVVPTAVKALGDLQAGLLALKDGLTAAGAGITQLAAGLTTVGAGVTKLGTFIGSDEYGVVQIAFGAAPGTPIPGCFYETANIPDNVQDAIVSGTCLVPAAIPEGANVRILAGIRSNESDGVASGAAAGVAGIVAYTSRRADLGTGGAVTTAGFGQTAPAAAGQPPAIDIPLKSAPTSTTETSFPFGPISTDNLIDLTATQFAGSPGALTLGATSASVSRTIEFTIRFNDLTADANDPTA